MKIKKKFVDFIGIYLNTTFIILLFLFCTMNPFHQFLTYDVKCNKIEDLCTISVHNIPIKIKEFKISEIKNLVNESQYDKSSKTTKYTLYLVKNNGEKIYAQGLIASGPLDRNFKKFNEFLVYGETSLEYQNNNTEHKGSFNVVLFLLALFAGLGIFKRYYYFLNEESDTLVDIQTVFSFKNIIIISLLLVFGLIVTISGIDSTIKILSSSSNCDLYSERLFDEQKDIFTDKFFDYNNGDDITNEKLKDIYYFSIEHMIDSGLYKPLLNNDNKLEILHYDLLNETKPACIQKMEFYAQKECLGANECYMKVSAVPYKKQNLKTEEFTYYLQFLKDKSSMGIQYFKINRHLLK